MKQEQDNNNNNSCTIPEMEKNKNFLLARMLESGYKF